LKKSRYYLLLVVFLVFSSVSVSSALVIDFTGGIATLSDGSTMVPSNTGYWDNVSYYVENGVRVDFVGADGIIGDYYSTGAGGFVGNDVLHAHWQNGITSIIFSMIDGSAFDLNYFDVTSNTVVGGGQQDGTEQTFISTANGTMLLPSSDWGFSQDFYGVAGDGVARLWMDSSFDNITSFWVTSQNAFCFGLDNFYINEEGPDPVPEPGTFLLLGVGLAGMVGYRKYRGKS